MESTAKCGFIVFTSLALPIALLVEVILYTFWKGGVYRICCFSNFRLETDEVSVLVRRSGESRSLE